MRDLIRLINKATKVVIRVDEATAATLDSSWENPDAPKPAAKRRASKPKETEPPVEAATDATASD